MPTDKERREVAARLRGGESLQASVRCVDGATGEDWHNILLLTADLVDRPTCEDVSDFDSEAFKCSRCGYRAVVIGGSHADVLLVSPEGLVSEWVYCPHCGAEVVRDGE